METQDIEQFDNIDADDDAPLETARSKRASRAGGPHRKDKSKRASAHIIAELLEHDNKTGAVAMGAGSGFAPSFGASRHERRWIIDALGGFHENHQIIDVVAHVKGGKELRQGADDTVAQAAGSQPIPPPNQANRPDFDKVEPAIAYGFCAHEEYGQKYASWDERLETKLSDQWDATKTGMKFEDVKPYVRRGWEYRK